MHLQRPDCGNHYSCVWLYSTVTTLDVHEFLAADVRAKAFKTEKHCKETRHTPATYLLQ